MGGVSESQNTSALLSKESWLYTVTTFCDMFSFSSHSWLPVFAVVVSPDKFCKSVRCPSKIQEFPGHCWSMVCCVPSIRASEGCRSLVTDQVLVRSNTHQSPRSIEMTQPGDQQPPTSNSNNNNNNNNRSNSRAAASSSFQE